MWEGSERQKIDKYIDEEREIKEAELKHQIDHTPLSKLDYIPPIL